MKQALVLLLLAGGVGFWYHKFQAALERFADLQ
jgi:hypothetical protein